jgi:hypothetical protein
MRPESVVNMDWDALWKSLFARVVWEVVVILGVGYLISWARDKRPQFVAAAQTILIFLACAAIIWFSVAGRPIFTPGVSEQNIESYVRTWLVEGGVGLRKTSNDGMVFEYEIIPSQSDTGFLANSGVIIAIAQPKPYPKRLLIHAGMTLDGETKTLIQALPQYQREQVAELLSIEMARAGVTFTIDHELKVIHISSTVLITNNLSEDTFYKEVERVDDAVVIAENLLNFQLTSRNGSKHR